MKKEVYGDEQMKLVRSKECLDSFRHKEFPDNILVNLYKLGVEPREVWVRVTEFKGASNGGVFHYFKARLLSEPPPEFLVHIDDEILVMVYLDNDKWVANGLPNVDVIL